MLDALTKQPLRVTPDNIAGPHLRLPEDQLDQIRQQLDRHAIRYWVDSNAISIDGGPEITYINFGPNSDAARIQAILDETE